MAARVSYADVLKLLDTEAEPSHITACILTADTWIDAQLVPNCAAASAGLLREISKWLAAHLVTSRDPRLKSSTLGDVSETYQVDPDNSDYIRTASALDPCGIVRATFMAGSQPTFQARVGQGYRAEAPE